MKWLALAQCHWVWKYSVIWTVTVIWKGRKHFSVVFAFQFQDWILFFVKGRNVIWVRNVWTQFSGVYLILLPKPLWFHSYLSITPTAREEIVFIIFKHFLEVKIFYHPENSITWKFYLNKNLEIMKKLIGILFFEKLNLIFFLLFF